MPGRTLLSALWSHDLTPPPEVEPAWIDALQELSSASERAYRQLVHHDPDFIEYFEQVTPREVELVKIGSRPAKRREAKSVADLRAIPWVFRWLQSRQLLPAWYGLGSALQRVAQLREVTGGPLLDREEDAAVARSIELKRPYLDPLNHLQVRLLADYRARAAEGAGSEGLELYERAVVASIEGIATGLGTTG